MPDLVTTNDRNASRPNFQMATPSPASAWSVAVKEGAVQHLGAPAPGFNTVTFPNMLINGEFSSRVTLDPGKLGDPNNAPNCCGHLVFRYLDPDRYYAFGIGGWGFNYSLFYAKPMMDAYRPWRVSGQHGDEKRRGKQNSFDLSIRILGSSLDCFVNGTRVFITTLPPDAHYQNGNVGFYAYTDSPVIFSDAWLRLDALRCFVVSPMNDKFDSDVYYPLKGRIERLKIAEHSVQCHRADQNSRSEPFIRTIIEQMKSANVTVVLVPGEHDCPENRNENVFYELGAAHSMGLPTIIYAKDFKRMPADLRHLNIITDEGRLVDAVKEVLSKDEYHPVYVA